ncbi:loricrin-like [Anopheles ziemanni]|uniref:loricrin-like n=1 Tax=Anopheles coustani TaxID=139045 RepID=UPI00265B4311|nr:loricrin-like [Anopheles coustani]XP_058174610.1 loricrin-like [Anopheles ziemanni]
MDNIGRYSGGGSSAGGGNGGTGDGTNGSGASNGSNNAIVGVCSNVGGLFTGGGAGVVGGADGSGSGSNFTRIRSTTRSTMAKATAVRVSTGKKFSQLLIITPAVAIDSNEHDDYNGPFNSSSLDSGCGGSSEGSLSDDPIVDEAGQSQGGGDRRNNNNGTRLLPLFAGGRASSSQTASASSSTPGWRWCGLICSAVKCFRAAAATTTGRQSSASVREPLAGTTVRYTTSEAGAAPSGRSRAGGRRPGAPRFSRNHVYEYTIKSYHHPQRERRSNGHAAGSRSASISSESSSLSGGGAVAPIVTADHDHINNNNGHCPNSSANGNGNIIMSSTLLPRTGSGAVVVTTTQMLTDTERTPSPLMDTGTARANERNNIMYKL